MEEALASTHAVEEDLGWMIVNIRYDMSEEKCEVEYFNPCTNCTTGLGK